MCVRRSLKSTCPQGVQQLHLLDCGGSLPTALLRALPLVAITIVRTDLASAEQASAAMRAANAEAPVEHSLHAAGSCTDCPQHVCESRREHAVERRAETLSDKRVSRTCKPASLVCLTVNRA